MRKYKLSVIAALLLIVLSAIPAFATEFPKPKDNFFVNDYADVIDQSDEEELINIGKSLYKQTTAQVVVVTVDSLDGAEIGDYALHLGREWGVGSKEKNNGVVILLSVSERKVTIQVGYGLEGRLTDGKTGRILDNYALPYFSDDDFSTGLSETYKAVVKEVYAEYGVEPEFSVENKTKPTKNDDNASDIILAIIIVLIISGSFGGGHRFLKRRIFFGPFIGRPGSFGGASGGRGPRGGGGFSGGGGSFGGGGSSRNF